ncbi:SulP family inorganic anion transporter [Humibacter soli]
MRIDLKRWFSPRTMLRDAVAGLVLGIESVPDGLASGVLAGVNPLAGLYGYLFGMAGAALFTGSSFMAVQATGAMSLIVSDAGLETRQDPDRALYTLAIMTGIVMIAAGLLQAGKLIRFVPTAVMTGFITAVGVNIVLGQLGNLTGYQAKGANRVVKTIDLLLHIGEWSLPAVIVGAVTILTIVLFMPTRVGSFGLVIAVVLGSVAAALLNLWVGSQVSVLDDIVSVPNGLPAPVLPDIGDVPFLALPAVSLAFVGLVQGAGVSAGIPSPDGRPADASRDFIGQGAGNLVSGLFRGMPVGGSMSASGLLTAAGAKTRMSLIYASVVMAIVILLASSAVGYVAMPALAGLLIVVGITTIKPSRVFSVIKSGPLQTTIMAVTFVLTLIIPLQFAVLVGVGLGIVLYVAQQSNRVRVRRVEVSGEGRLRETDPPSTVDSGEVLVLQPYGSLFFASAPILEQQLPAVTAASGPCVVIVRLRGTDEIGLALIEVLRRLHRSLVDADSTLKLVVSEKRVCDQLITSGLAAEIGEQNLYRGTEWVGETLRTAYADARRELGTTKA